MSFSYLQQKQLKLRPVIDYINTHYDQILTLEELADIMKITPQHLCLLFKNIMQIRPFEYLNQVRINKSKDFLINNFDLTIGEIAKMVGYDSTSYFCFVFKNIEGFSPGAFRKRHRKKFVDLVG